LGINRLAYQLALKKQDKSLLVIRNLSTGEYAEYQQALILICQFSYTDNLFRIKNLNYNEFFKTQNLAIEEYSKNPWNTDCVFFENTELNLNRCLLNYLSSVRTFLDHTELKLKRLYGENSNQYMNFRNATSKAYDGCFSYRFVYSLRNYCQHCGMPIGRMGFSSQKSQSGTINSLYILARKDDLVKSNVWNKKITKEIQDLPEEFDMVPHIQSMATCLAEVEKSILQQDLPWLIKSAKFIKQVLQATEGKEGDPMIIWLSKELVGNPPIMRTKVNNEFIPIHTVNYILNNLA
jgi:hypothetical protein